MAVISSSQVRNAASRREFLLTAGAAAIGGSLMSRSTPAESTTGTAPILPGTRRPNILLFIVDDQGSLDAGCYGSTQVRTPALDDLAANGVRMTSAFCTTPSCSASRSVILTGMHNHATGQFGHAQPPANFRTSDTVRSLPGILRAAGYRTANVGKFHVAPESVYPYEHFINKEYMGGMAWSDEMAAAAAPVIASKDQRPFFISFCTREPHRPYFLRKPSRFDPASVEVPPFLPDSPECRRELADYYASVEQADEGLARMLELVRQSGRWDDTVIIYLSDNGVAFPGAKTNLYDPGIRLPLVIRDPAQKKQGHACDAMVTYADIAPTVLDIAGLSAESAGMHGRSFAKALANEKPAGWDEVNASHTFHEITMYYPMRMVRDRTHKLIWNIAHPLTFPSAADLYDSKAWQGVLTRADRMFGKRTVDAYLHRPAFELYDLTADPDEVRNLADDPAHAAKLEEMKAKLRAFMEKSDDPWVVKWRYE